MAFTKLYDRKNVLVAADILNDKVIPWFEEQEVRILHLLKDRGTESCRAHDRHEYELYVALRNIDNTKKKPSILRRMVSVKDCIRRYRMSFTLLLSGERFIIIWRNCK